MRYSEFSETPTQVPSSSPPSARGAGEQLAQLSLRNAPALRGRSWGSQRLQYRLILEYTLNHIMGFLL